MNNIITVELDKVQVNPSEHTQIHKKRYVVMTTFGRRFTTFIKVTPSLEVMEGIDRGRLRSCQIQTSEGIKIAKAFNFQLNRIRNRWNVAIKRSTGFVLLDTAVAVFFGFLTAGRGALRLIFGTRTRLSDLLEGAEFQSRTIEEQKEVETMVFASIAAIFRAAKFTAEGSSEVVYLDDDFMKEVKGLTFAGGMIGTMGQADNEDSAEDDDDDLDDFDLSLIHI